MFDVIAAYVGGLIVGGMLVSGIRRIRRRQQPTGAAVELDITNLAFIRAAFDELDAETLKTIEDGANEYCERWETPLRFDISEVDA